MSWTSVTYCYQYCLFNFITASFEVRKSKRQANYLFQGSYSLISFFLSFFLENARVLLRLKMRCLLFVMADAQATVYWAVGWWVTLQTPLQKSECRAGLMPSNGHETGGDLSFPMIQEKIQPGATVSL